MKRSDSQDAAEHVGCPRLSHQDQLDELGQHQDQRLRRGQTAAARGGWPLPSCLGPSGKPSQSSEVADPAAAIMSSTSSSSASSVCSDGRKRKESCSDTGTASKRYRHVDPLCLTSLSTVCTAAGSSLTQIEETGGLQFSTDPATSVSCVEDANNEQCSTRFGIGPVRHSPGLSAMSRSAKTNRPSCKRIGEASCEATAGGISTRLSRGRVPLTREGSSEESGSDEDVTSSGPGRGHAMGHGLAFVGPTVASKRRKMDKCDSMEAELTECSTRDMPSLRFPEEDADCPTRTVSSGEVELACSSPDDQSTSAPLFVLSSGRLSKGEEVLLGRRPPTVDDEFDRYFKKLML